MARSFFERLTGSMRMSENGEREEAKPREPLARLRKSKPEPAERPRTIHPTGNGEVMSEESEDLSLEEGQLTVDIYDDGQNIIIQSTVAGVRPENIDISLQDDTLTIRGDRRRTQQVSNENFYYKELYWGAFSRSIILPEEVEFPKADAVIKNGLLTIKLPKKDRGEKKIRVKFSE